MTIEIENDSKTSPMPEFKLNTDASAKLLASAFATDPLFDHFFPDESNRQPMLFYTFRFIVAHAARNGVVNNAGQPVNGVSVWLPSDKIYRSLADQIRFGALRMAIKQGRAAISRQVAASDYMKSVHRQLLDEPHWYLSTIGVEVSVRGSGVASELIKPMLARADEVQQPCYLDTHNEENLPKYRRYGFEVAHQSQVPDSSVEHWAMIRMPRQ